MVTRKIILILVSTTKFDLLSFMPKTVFYNLRNPFSTVFSLKIFKPFIAPHKNNVLNYPPAGEAVGR